MVADESGRDNRRQNAFFFFVRDATIYLVVIYVKVTPTDRVVHPLAMRSKLNKRAPPTGGQHGWRDIQKYFVTN